MAELNYAKKRLQPIIDKYGIDTENDKVFQSIITLFNGQTDYQIWGLKVVYSRATTLDDLIFLKEWANSNPTEISQLSQKNLVSYKNASEIAQLHKEIANINAYHLVKNVIATFNTDQRNLLKTHVLDKVTSPIASLENSTFAKFFDVATQFNTLPKHRKESAIILMSALRNFSELMKFMKNTLQEEYTWDREDMLSFAQRNCPDAEVCFDNGKDIVILRVGSFETVEKLCGKGRTAWCLTREKRYFKQYTEENENAQQFAFFNFSLPEKDELAHVGFSVNPRRGINYAHSTKNHNMMGHGVHVNGENWSINRLLSHHSIPKSAYIRLKQLQNYKWDKGDFLRKMQSFSDVKIIDLNDGRIAIPLDNDRIWDFILGHTLSVRFSGNNNSKFFAVIDFSKDLNDEHSIILVHFSKDAYGVLSIKAIADAYGVNNTEKRGLLQKHNLDENAFIGSVVIAPNILLHKYIDEGNIAAAIKLLNENEEIDPNHMFLNNLPIIKSLTCADKDLFNAISNHPKFDTGVTEAFGEPYAQFLLLYLQSNVIEQNKAIEPYLAMCESIIENEKYDKNRQDFNGDTLLHLACESTPELLPIVRNLVARPDINVNLTNVFGYTPLDIALETRNIEAVKVLLTRPDIEINDATKNLAQKFCNINLDEMRVTMQNPDAMREQATQDVPEEYSDLFARAFSGSQK